MNKTTACALLFMVAFLWGCGNVAQKTVLVHLGPFTVVGITSLLGALIIWPYVMWEERSISRLKIDRSCRLEHWIEISFICIFFSGAVVTMQLGYGGTSVTNAGFLVNANVAMIPITAWFLAKERPNLFVIPSAILTCAGIWLMQGARFDKFNEGDLLSFVAAVLFAIWTPLVGRFVKAHGRPGFLTLCQFMVCGTACLTYAFSVETMTSAALWQALPELILLGIIGKGTCYLFMAVAQQHASSSVASIIVSSEAVFGAIFASFILFETITNTGILGALLVSIATVTIQYPDLKFDGMFGHYARHQPVQKQPVTNLSPPPNVIKPGDMCDRLVIQRSKACGPPYATGNPGKLQAD